MNFFRRMFGLQEKRSIINKSIEDKIKEKIYAEVQPVVSKIVLDIKEYKINIILDIILNFIFIIFLFVSFFVGWVEGTKMLYWLILVYNIVYNTYIIIKLNYKNLNNNIFKYINYFRKLPKKVSLAERVLLLVDYEVEVIAAAKVLEVTDDLKLLLVNVSSKITNEFRGISDNLRELKATFKSAVKDMFSLMLTGKQSDDIKNNVEESESEVVFDFSFIMALIKEQVRVSLTKLHILPLFKLLIFVVYPLLIILFLARLWFTDFIQSEGNLLSFENKINFFSALLVGAALGVIRILLKKLLKIGMKAKISLNL